MILTKFICGPQQTYIFYCLRFLVSRLHCFGVLLSTGKANKQTKMEHLLLDLQLPSTKGTPSQYPTDIIGVPEWSICSYVYMYTPTHSKSENICPVVFLITNLMFTKKIYIIEHPPPKKKNSIHPGTSKSNYLDISALINVN